MNPLVIYWVNFKNKILFKMSVLEAKFTLALNLHYKYIIYIGLKSKTVQRLEGE